ncbi:hypothetical protein F4680DRAFT_416596 [Xylaria scruposa]|nr:hypothetical protein F4680DRAFT_416596 [Xylaria scruposa]
MTSLNERCLFETKSTALSHSSRSSYSVHRSLQIAVRLKLDQDENERMLVLGHVIGIMRRVTPHSNASLHVFSVCLAFKAAYPAILGTEELARLFYDTGFHYWERRSAVPRDGVTLLLTAEGILDRLGYDEP